MIMLPEFVIAFDSVEIIMSNNLYGDDDDDNDHDADDDNCNHGDNNDNHDDNNDNYYNKMYLLSI